MEKTELLEEFDPGWKSKYVGKRVRYWRDIHDSESTELGTVTDINWGHRKLTVELDCAGTVSCGFMALDFL